MSDAFSHVISLRYVFTVAWKNLRLEGGVVAFPTYAIVADRTISSWLK